MLRIRLQRRGKRGQPTYRIVVTDSKVSVKGAALELLGHYNPRTAPPLIKVEEERVKEWLARGAQPSERVAKLLSRLGPQGEQATPTSDVSSGGES